MKKIITAFLACVITTSGVAQPPTKQWDLRYGGNEDDNMTAMQPTIDGGYILAGSSESGISGEKSQSNQGGLDYWILKIDSMGIKQWDSRFGGIEDDNLTSIQQTSDSGYILGGYSRSKIGGDKTNGNNGKNDYWIVKTDANGIKQWDKNFGGNLHDYLQVVRQALDGGYILGGYTESGISGDKTQASQGGDDYWIIKTDGNGIKQWDFRYGGTEDDQLYDLLLQDDGYILTGLSKSDISGDKTQENQNTQTYPTADYWLVKIDLSGVKQWDWGYGGGYEDNLLRIIQTSDGAFLLGGESNSQSGGDKSHDSWLGTHDYWIVKVDANGIKEWDSKFGGSGYDVLRFILQTNEGGYLVGGPSGSQNGGEKTQPNQGACGSDDCDYDMWMVKLASNGLKQWDVRYGGASIDGLTNVKQTVDGGYFLAGSSKSSVGADQSQEKRGKDDFWVVKTDKGGPLSKILTQPFFYPSYLPGDQMKVYFLTTIPFNSDNIFTAELSDSNGNYSSPVVIGSIASTTSDTISCTLPVSLPIGSGYRVRVKSSHPPFTGYDQGYEFAVGDSRACFKQWDARFGGNKDDEINTMIQTHDGGYLLGGFSWSPISGEKSEPNYGYGDYWIIKTDAYGIFQWDHTFGGSSTEEVTEMIQLSNGDYLIAGTSNSGISGNKTIASKGGEDFWIVRLDSNGVKLAEYEFGGTGYDDLRTILKTSDGGFLMGGQSSSGISGDKSEETQGGFDYWILKTDANLVKQWDKRYGGSGTETFSSVIQTTDGGYLLGGSSESPASGDKSHGDYGNEYKGDYWIVKTDSNGVKQWDATFGGNHIDDLGGFNSRGDHTLIQTADGGFLIGGTSGSAASGNKAALPIGGDDFWIVKTDANGTKLWDKTYGGNWIDEFSSMTQSDDGTYMLMGYTYSCVLNEYVTVLSRGGADFFILRIDSSGNKISDSRFGGNANSVTIPSGNGNDIAYSLLHTSDGGFLLGGWTYSNNNGDVSEETRGALDYWIVKTDNGLLMTLSCEIPTGLFKSSIKSTSAKVNWNVVTEAESFSVRYRKTGTTPWTKTTAQLNYKKLTGLSPNTQYDWGVKSVCEPGVLTSDWTETQTFTTKPLRLENDDEEITFNVFPNPSAGVFTVDLAVNEDELVQARLDVLNIFGQVIYSENGEIENGILVKEIEMRNAPDGIYLVRLFINGQVYTSQINLQR